MQDPYAMQGPPGMPPGMMPPPGMPPGMDMGMVPPGPEGMPPEGMPPDMGEVPPGPDGMLGADPEEMPITVPGWIPADPSIPIDETTCAEIDAIPFEDKDGKPFCM